MTLLDASTIILIVTWAVGLTPGWLVFVPVALDAIAHAYGRMMRGYDDEID